MRLLRPIFLLLGGVARLIAQDHCSLIVQVVDPSGGVIAGVPVTVEEVNGRVVSSSVEGGEARFCDLGVSSVTVSVGASTDCDYTVVRNVPLVWGLPRKLRIVFDRTVCQVDGPPPTFLCSVLLRFIDEAGRWIPAVEFNPPIQRSPNLRSDSYGRAMVRMSNGEGLRTFTDKHGYLPERIDLNCSSNLTIRERIVTLRKTR
jgi:hypothetical protein